MHNDFVQSASLRFFVPLVLRMGHKASGTAVIDLTSTS
jgi:hypothetical protein